MNKEPIRDLLEDVRNGRVPVEDAMNRLRSFPYDDIGYAKIDTHRALRKGFPEVIFCQGKTVEQIAGIVLKMKEHGGSILGMRAWPEAFDAVRTVTDRARYFPEARAILVGEKPPVTSRGTVVVVSAGTADIPVAEEAALTAEVLGSRVEKLFDVGVAGLHRLLDRRDVLFKASVLVVVAGMEGALPSVVGGLVDRPLIAVPTSVGYGASLGGLSALMTMLTSCVPGIGVVNIDNGFGAGYLAALINRLGDTE
ncbi:MAG: nickel pincer cofactor biosynthesis protein LarB [bacterium]|nr:nickel pincer cofactor biosynthesis protein LarB [bacterium]